MATVPSPGDIGGFSLKRPNYKPRLVVSLGGLDKSGKTNFALSAPGPMAYANFDTGLEGVIDKFTKTGKKVYSQDYRVTIPPGTTDPSQVAAIAQEVWARYKADVRAALKSPLIRSIVTDTESETWELIRLARFGKLTQVLPHHYGPVNTEYRNFYNEVYDTDKNLILLGRMKDEWENTTAVIGGQTKEVGRKTGRIERVGFKEIPYMVQINAIASHDPMAEPGERFSLQVVNCRQNAELVGEVIPQVVLNFAQVAQMVYPDSQPEMWE